MPKTILAMTSLKPNGEEALEKYLSVVGPLMEKAGAKLITRYEISENLSDTEVPQYVSVVEYPDDETLQMVFSNPDYISLKAVREKAFSRYDICVIASPTTHTS
ncbi:MAG: DUF1330 domain-containing protein [Halopseudomonas aestusnigri]